MAQFSVHENRNPLTRERVPFLLDLQSDLLADLPTRLVAPLYVSTEEMRDAPARLCPAFSVRGCRVVMYPHEAAGISVKVLGKIVADLLEERTRIVDAIDALISGV